MANPDYLFARPEASRVRTLPVIPADIGREFETAAKVLTRMTPAGTAEEIEDGIAALEALKAGFLTVIETVTADIHKGLDGLLNERGEPGRNLHFEDEVNATFRRLIGDVDPDYPGEPDSLRFRLQLVYDRSSRQTDAA